MVVLGAQVGPHMLKLFLALLLALGGCAPVVVTEGPMVSSFAYRLGSGDRVRIMTFGEEKLSGEFVVSGEGAIAFPLVGDIPARGQTIAQLRTALTASLAQGYLRSPQLTVEVINYRPVYILGEVMRPGEFAYTERLSVLALVAKAGGFSYRANRSVVFIAHEGDTKERGFRLSSGTAVQPGDVVRIDQRYF